jgi:K+-transporting ATPase KdpF subunit
MCVVARSYSEVKLMNLESILGLVVAALLLIYLAYALLRPEKF